MIERTNDSLYGIAAEKTTFGGKVVFIGLSAHNSHGGIQRFNRRVIAALNHLSVAAASIMLLDQSPGLSGGVNAAFYGSGGNRKTFLAQAIRLGIQADKMLLGHINLLPVAIVLKLLRPSLRIYLFAHGVEVWGDPGFRRPRRWESTVIRKMITKVAIVSNFSRSRMMVAFQLPLEKFVIFPNAVDDGESIPVVSKRSNILCVSRLAESERDKNIDKILRALPAVIRQCPNARLQIVGQGGLASELRKLASELGVERSVDFFGAVSDADLQSAYHAASVFALPSSKEGFGIVYLEAWKAGIPVIGSVFGASSETISDGIDGFTVDPSDIDLLARRLITLLTDDQLACRMAKAGLDKVREKYSMQAFVANLSKIVHGP